MIGVRDAAETAKTRFKKRLADPREVWGAPYGIPSLDRITGGVHKGELSALIADSGVGKSSLGGQFALNIASWLKENAPGWDVRIVGLEMSPDAYMNRMSCSESGVPLNRVRDGFAQKQKEGVSREFLEEQQRRYNEAADRIASLPIHFITASDINSVDEIVQFIKEPVESSRCAWWLLDHLNITPGSDGDSASLSATVNKLTQIARKIAPGMVLTQMNKAALMREDKRPLTTDVFNTSKVKQNSDLILGLYREDKYVKWDDARWREPRPAELSILKQREGDETVIDLWLLKDRMIWTEKEKDRAK